jgi:hypothetical protein
MKIKKLLTTGFVGIIIIITIAYSSYAKFNLDNASQDPDYIINARTQIIGKWYQENAPKNTWEFKNNGKLIIHFEDNIEYTVTYTIVNTTPVCGKNVQVDIRKRTMYLIVKDEDGIEECDELFFIQGSNNNSINLTPVGRGVDASTIFHKK